MAQQLLLSSLGKAGVDLELLTMKVDVEDTSYLSKYFVIAEFNPIFTAGKNSIAFNGSSFLKTGSEIKIQCLDSNDNSLYLEYPKSSTQFNDVANFVVSIHIYNETYNGPGKLIIVGTTTKGEIVRWIGNISIDKTLRNISKTRFYGTPTIEARPLLYPIVSNAIAQDLTQIINFTGSFYAYAVNPVKDTIQSYINPKITDIDYRLVYNSPNNNIIGSQLYPTSSFNSQMEGQIITFNTVNIQEPFSYKEKYTDVTASFKIKKVIDSKTIQLSNAFFYSYGKDSTITNINFGYFTSSYKWISYNTNPDAYQIYTPASGDPIYTKKSYAEITYKNIRPFSGFIARHKLYRKSTVYPGDYQLVVDEPLGTQELLIDPITVNKSYNLMGKFYNDEHIKKYWYTSSKELQLSHSVIPYIDAMRIGRASASYDNIDGNKYVIVKIDSIGVTNDCTYLPYDTTQFNNIQGLNYNSNFVDLKSGSLYVLSMDLMVEKDISNSNAKIQFFFTSSIDSINKEKSFVKQYGMKIGEIVVSDYTNVKIFSDKQTLYFTPSNNYYGTLVIVPYQCTPTIANLSLGVYSDYGFSPDSLTTKIPFPINVANETWQLKAELFDINFTLVYSDLYTVQTFDVDGESLMTFVDAGTSGGGMSLPPPPVIGDFVVDKDIYLPNIPTCDLSEKRLLGWTVPTNSPPTDADGQVCYTNIENVELIPTNTLGSSTSLDYIKLSTVDSTGVIHYNEQSIVVRYNGSTSGKRIYIDSSGTKTTST